MSVVVEGGHGGQGQQRQDLQREFLALVVPGLGGEAEEAGDVLGALGLGGGGAVVVLNDPVVEWGGHRNSAPPEIGVEVEAFVNHVASGGVHVPSQQREQVVLKENVIELIKTRARNRQKTFLYISRE